MAAERILVVAAHADDEVIGCGGTIAKHASEGHDVFIIFKNSLYNILKFNYKDIYIKWFGGYVKDFNFKKKYNIDYDEEIYNNNSNSHLYLGY